MHKWQPSTMENIVRFVLRHARFTTIAVRRKIYSSTAAAGGATPILGVLAATTLAAS
jgi:hypothetical protein